jgi:hypothetical protein
MSTADRPASLRTGFALALMTALGVVALGDPAPARAGSSRGCDAPPTTMRIEAAGNPVIGDDRFEVVDGVARRVAILPKASADVSNRKARDKLTARAAGTGLALYSVYLADFKIPRRDVEGFTLGRVDPKAGGTIGTLTIVPPKKRGLREGDTVTDRELAYDTTTTFGAVGVTVDSDPVPPSTRTFDDVAGRVEILELDDDEICVDVDLEFTRDGDLVTAMQGTVAVPVVRAPDTFYFT